MLFSMVCPKFKHWTWSQPHGKCRDHQEACWGYITVQGGDKAPRHHKQRTPQWGRISRAGQGEYFSWHAGPARTPRVLLSQSRSVAFYTVWYSEDSFALRSQGSMTGNAYGLGERGSRWERKCLERAEAWDLLLYSGFRIWNLYSPQTTFLENRRKFLNTTAPHVGSAMAVTTISLGNSWLMDYRNGFLVHR